MRLFPLYCLILLSCLLSCRKIDDYFQEPDTKIIGQTILTTYAVGYSANVAMTVMSGHQLPGIICIRSNQGYPCTSVIVVNTDHVEPFISENIGKLIITGLWASEDAGILTVLFTNFTIASAEFKLLSIKTFPVTRQENSIIVAFGGMDIDLNPESDELFTINLSEQEVDSEFSRLGEERPEDLYLAVEQNAYFIGIEQNNTPSDISDDLYSFTGGGQLVEISNNSVETYQQAMIEVELSSSCISNPTNGFALLRKVSIQDESFPELGTAILEFHEECDAKVKVDLATGIYIGANNKSIEFNFE